MSTFYETVRDRKSLVPSARHKVNGSKSRKCSLPSDNLTDAQKRKLNGPVKTYAINRPMPWEAFKSMPADLQQAHLDYIQNRFQLGAATIGRVYFGVSDYTVLGWVKRKGLQLQSFRGSCSASRVEELKKWVAFGDFCEPEEPETEVEATDAEEPMTEDANICADYVAEEKPFTGDAPDAEPSKHAIREMHLKLAGDSAQICEALLTLISGRRAGVEVSIRFND